MPIMIAVTMYTGSLIHSKSNSLYAMLQSVIVIMIGYPAVMIGNPQVIMLVRPKFEITEVMPSVMIKQCR